MTRFIMLDEKKKCRWLYDIIFVLGNNTLHSGKYNSYNLHYLYRDYLHIDPKFPIIAEIILHEGDPVQPYIHNIEVLNFYNYVEFLEDKSIFVNEKSKIYDLPSRIIMGRKTTYLEKIKTLEKFHDYIKYFDDLSLELPEVSIGRNGRMIKYVKDPSLDLQLIALRQTYEAYNYINNPHPIVTELAIAMNGLFIKHIENPSERLMMIAISSNSDSLQYIKEQGDTFKLDLLRYDGKTIKIFQDPSEEYKLIAVTQDGKAIKYIKDSSDNIKTIAVKNSYKAIKYIDDPSERLKLLAIRTDIRAYKYIKNPSDSVKDIFRGNSTEHKLKNLDYIGEEEQISIITKNPKLISHFKKPSKEVQKAAVSVDHNVVTLISNPDIDAIDIVLKSNPSYIRTMKCPSERRQIIAFEEDPTLIQYLKKTFYESQAVAIRKDPSLIRYIKKPGKKITSLAASLSKS